MKTFDFYRANLQRKFGADWEASWRETALKRLPAWGFNTIGNWSSRALYRNGKVPYTATTSVGVCSTCIRRWTRRRKVLRL